MFVLLDDQSPFDLKIHDAKSILETTNIDKSDERGMLFEGARRMGSMNGAVCTPSPHMIMSGRTVWHLPASEGKVSPQMCPERYTRTKSLINGGVIYLLIMVLMMLMVESYFMILKLVMLFICINQ